MTTASTLRQAVWPLLVGFATVTAVPAVLAQAASGSGTPWFEDAAAEAGPVSLEGAIDDRGRGVHAASDVGRVGHKQAALIG